MPLLIPTNQPNPPGSGPCAPWASLEDACAPCNSYESDGAALAAGIDVASEVLYNLTGRRWPGECEDTIRPPSQCGCPAPDRCACGTLSQYRLPGYPATAITEVVVDGVVVPAARYRIDNWRWLVYLPDPANPTEPIGGWPRCQHDNRPATEAGTWQVTYLFGQAPPLGGVRAAASYGCQLALACSPDPAVSGQCRLPKRVTTITRQGTTIAVLDPMTLVADGMTGLAEVDLWVASVLKGDARRRATAFVPGRRHPARRTTG